MTSIYRSTTSSLDVRDYGDYASNDFRDKSNAPATNPMLLDVDAKFKESISKPKTVPESTLDLPRKTYEHLCCEAYENTLCLRRAFDQSNESDILTYETEIIHAVRQLYDIPVGDEECLKRIVVAIQSQISNASLTKNHIDFLESTFRFLKSRFLMNSGAVEIVLDLIDDSGLDVFRGTVQEPVCKKRYRIVEE